VANQHPAIGVYGENPYHITQLPEGTYNLTEDMLHGRPYANFGAHATDWEDGAIPLTGDNVSGLPIDISTPGSYDVTYSVTDSYGNYAEAIRTVTVVADELPVITMCGDNVTIKFGEVYTEADDNAQGSYCSPVTSVGAFATDFEDIDLTVTATPSTGRWPMQDLVIGGTYYVTYSATDSFGHEVFAQRTINCIENSPPNISLEPPAEVVFVADSDALPYVDPGAKADDGDGIDITDQIVIVIKDNTSGGTIAGPIPLHFAGNYTMEYTVTDQVNVPVSVERSVIIEGANLPPTINGFENSEPANVGIAVYLYASIADLDGEELRSYEFTLAAAPEGSILNDNGTFKLNTIDPPSSSMTVNAVLIPEKAGSYTVKLAVSDGVDTAVASHTFEVVEDPLNTVTQSADNTVVSDGTVVS